jgi:hypothetical protein
MLGKQAAEVRHADPEPFGQPIDACPVKSAGLDERQRPLD